MTGAPRILLIEDDEDDYFLARDLLCDTYGPALRLDWIRCWDAALEAITAGGHDVYLVDYRLGARTGLELIQEAVALGSTAPFILLTGQDSREVDLEAMRAGVADYLVKGEITGALVDRTIRYAMERKRREAQLLALSNELGTQNVRFDAALNNMIQGLCMFDAKQRLIVCNERYRQMYGLSPEVVRPGVTLREIMEHSVALGNYTEEDAARAIAKRTACAVRRERAILHQRLADGRVIVVMHEPMADGGSVASYQDVTDAQYDPLTGAANRSLFRNHLATALTRADRHRRVVALMMLDLDRFKIINDTFGHVAGDWLLKAVACRLKSCIREGDLIARLGGDEFAIVLADCAEPGDPYRIATRVLEVVQEPVVFRDRVLHTTASVGIASYPGDASDVDSLFESADTAMYRAKEQGAGNFQFYTAAMRIQAAQRLELENGLRRALECNELRLVYQPQVNLRNGQITGMEALLRWQHPERGLVYPGDFIAVAEETGLIVPIGEWALYTASAQARAWQRAGLPCFRVAINLSARQFQEKDLAGTVGRILRASDLDPRFLEVEITESSMLRDPEGVRRTLARLTAMGLHVALDDFGTGCSSLTHLRMFPGAAIKVDRSFIKDICSDQNAAAIVRAVVGLAHNRGLAVVAEGVETVQQLARVRELGCDAIQGYLFSRPLLPAQVTRALFSRPLTTGRGAERASHAPGSSYARAI